MSDSPPMQRTLREKIAAAREATGQLRDAARVGRVIHFRERDELVMAIHSALDALDALLADPVAPADRCCDLTVTHTHGVLRADGTFTADPSED
jgi:hypothetical protein